MGSPMWFFNATPPPDCTGRRLILGDKLEDDHAPDLLEYVED